MKRWLKKVDAMFLPLAAGFKALAYRFGGLAEKGLSYMAAVGAVVGH